MTRKDFELIADTIRNLRDASYESGVNELQREMIAKQFAAALRSTNPNFNRDRFVRACGVEA